MSIFGGDTGVSYEQLMRRRKIADAMGKEAMGAAPRNVGEGLNAIAAALVGRYQQKQFDKGSADFRKQRGDTDPLVQALMMGTTAPITQAVNRGEIPAYSRGTNYHPGGLAVVGEEGPELAVLPKGAKVLPTEMAQSFFGRDGQMLPQQPSGSGTQVAPEPWMNRLNTLQFRIPELREKMEAYPEEAPQIQQELQQMERERQQILDRYQPQGFQTAQAGMPNDPSAPPLGVGVNPYSQIGGESGRVGAPRQGGSGDVAPVDGFGVPQMRGVNPPQAMPWDSGAFDQSRFDDANSYQVAQADTGTVTDAAPSYADRARDADLDMNVTQAQRSGQALRLLQSESILRELENQGTRTGQRALEMLPDGVENLVIDEDYGRFKQARDAFAEAAMRADTGATINESEWPRIVRNLMPQPGDGPERIAQRRAMREVFIQSLLASSGEAAKLMPEIGQPVVPLEQMDDDQFLKSLGLE